MDHVGENRQMISLSRTDEVDDERTVHQEHGVVVTSCSLMMSDTAPSPARYRRQFDIVPKEIKLMKYVLDPGAPRLLSVSRSVMTSMTHSRRHCLLKLVDVWTIHLSLMHSRHPNHARTFELPGSR